MRSTAARAALGAALVIAAVVLFLLLQGDSEEENLPVDGGEAPAKREPASGSPAPGAAAKRPAAPTDSAPRIIIRDGAPVGGPETITVAAGERVRFRVSSDAAEEIHVHGYDVTREVPPGGTATVAFDADLEGIYEVELHGSGEQIAELRVEP